MPQFGAQLRLQEERNWLEKLRGMSESLSPEHQERHQKTIAAVARRLAFLEQDVQGRELSPLFHRAVSLFRQGYRLEQWGDDFGVLTGNTRLTRGSEELEFWALTSPEEDDRDDARFYRAVGLDCTSEVALGSNYWVLWHLDNLSQEERLAAEQLT